MIKAKENGYKYILISNFHEYLGKIHFKYTGHVQHDAQELFRLLLDDMS